MANEEKIRILDEQPAENAGSLLYIRTLAGSSDASKPTSLLANGSIFIETDTGKVFIFDEDNGWTEMQAGGGGGGLPSVTSSDNGKVLAVKDGAWAADSNLFVAEFSGSPLTCNKTYQEIVDAVNAGMTVIGVRGNDVYIYSGKDTTNVIFTRISGKNLTVARIALSSSNTAQAAGASLAPATTSFDDGCELIVKNGAWAKQQKKFVVTLTPTAQDFSGTMDKTPAEITAAYGAGQEIVFDIPSMNAKINATQFIVENDAVRAGGMVYYDVNSSPVIITVTTDSSASTYATQIFAMTPAS